MKRVDHDYKVGDKVMINNHAAYNYETTYRGPFVITQCWNNGTIKLQCHETRIRYSICRMKPHTSDKNIEYIKY